MARHNRSGGGVDQCGYGYEISYQPDWLARVKVTRRLPSGRQSTKVLFKNPARAPVEAPPAQVRVSITSREQKLDIESMVGPQVANIRQLRIDWAGASGTDARMSRLTFTLVPFRTR